MAVHQGVEYSGRAGLPMAAANLELLTGGTFREAAIRVVAYSSASTGITSFALILCGLRIKTAEPEVRPVDALVARCCRLLIEQEKRLLV